MVYTERHRWCAGKIQECFGAEVSADAAQLFVRGEESHSKFLSLFKGSDTNVGRLFVFFQPAERSAAAEGESSKQLVLSDGNNVLMESKCCYFVRNVVAGSVMDLTKSGDSDLLYGELGTSALGTIEAILSQSYLPMLTSYDNWGKADEEQKKDFVSEFSAFITNINETLSSFANGLVLRAPDPRLFAAIEQKMHRGGEVKIQAETLDHFEQLLSEWCTEMSFHLDQTSGSALGDDIGPRGELEYWRARMQKLTSITEQLKRTDCKQGKGLPRC